MAHVKSSNLASKFPGLKSSPSTLICLEKTVILGQVTIGPDCVVHPTAQILAKAGPIIIGSSNLIEERATIINDRETPLLIGDNNVFEVDSYCEAVKIGSHNVLESKSSVGSNIELTDSCVIGAGCSISNSEDETRVLAQNTIIVGRDLRTRVLQDPPTSSQTFQLDFLRKILPNYQKIWRPANLAGTPTQK